MTVWLIAAMAVLACYVPIGIVCLRGEAIDRLVALEAANALTIVMLSLIAEALKRQFLFDLPLALALLSFAGGLVFARFLERWM
jgi:multicomponent Na+:H+ antiporter subunit F